MYMLTYEMPNGAVVWNICKRYPQPFVPHEAKRATISFIGDITEEQATDLFMEGKLQPHKGYGINYSERKQ